MSINTHMGIINSILKTIGLQTVQKDGVPLANNTNWPMVGSADPMAGIRLFGGWGQSDTGINVNSISAMGSTAVYGAVRAISEDLGKLPIQVRKALPHGGETVDHDHPLNRLFDRPSRWHNRFDFISYMATSFELRGNAFIYCSRDDLSGEPVELLVINPDRMSVQLSGLTGELVYTFSHPLLGASAAISCGVDDMMHVKGVSHGGFLGISPIAAHANAIGLALATEAHGATVFKNGAYSPGVLMTPMKVGAEGIGDIRNGWYGNHSGAHNAGKIAILEEGMTYQSISMNSKDAQYLETREFQIIEICRAFRIPPSKLFDLSDAHYANLAQQTQAYVDDALVPIADRFEQEAQRVLLFNDERRKTFIHIDFSSMLRADLKTRYDSHAVATGSPFRTINEVRAEEGLPPVADGDKIRVPLNTAPVGSSPKNGDTKPPSPDTDKPSARVPDPTEDEDE